MSTRNIIYDKRFLNGSFDGHAVAIPDDKIDNISNGHSPLYYDVVLTKSVRHWLMQHGPWKQRRQTFYFARESTAAMFKLRYC